MSKIIFMGTPDFSTAILEMLIDTEEVIAVVTQPDRPVGRKRVLTPPPVKKVAVAHDIPVYQPEKLSGSAELETLLQTECDLIVTAAFGQLLPESLLEHPKFGAVNVHASLLPKYRGGAPIHQAIIDGEAETGVTIMYMVKKLDAGDIISQQAIPIEDKDNVGTMHDKLSRLGTELLKETLPSIINGTNDRTPQDEALVSFASNIQREDERIDWTQDARTIFNHIRGLSPWPVAYTTFEDKNMKLYEAQLVKGQSGRPGEIIDVTKKHIIVGTGSDDAVALTEIQLAGKKRMSVAQFLSGFQTSLVGKELI
ncbi:methionyl-tRNA formyltransferase [Staphylococcus pseudintermedius]|uniref:methionyl-tRNA formyltransferase n=1 Tax=Staphylococcus pseudintermedius TaxID=283734 RepID=UPI000E270D6B|nr:methionyl-tRNA formyltransferase [Staphylococcus pseudintermedius]EGQ2685061.1 methionyl-tRNA formyltransferase [Staphylococcus pseudintermedius]EGQ3250742.1 methionyl-tRNA formyltransferase [Staphylococcus pseudintermedius]EGQ3591456.1 methionyl-tRNA formyltransferase [Staphylococcus pseudintermedius]EIE3589726.1 methionyl-tRNA formyltransferase [Staphylococcus pseudintermedius]EIT1272114.1 methionyl-tRNA formyltransferase [Staphylococcus pseudintermedius]